MSDEQPQIDQEYHLIDTLYGKLEILKTPDGNDLLIAVDEYPTHNPGYLVSHLVRFLTFRHTTDKYPITSDISELLITKGDWSLNFQYVQSSPYVEGLAIVSYAEVPNVLELLLEMFPIDHPSGE